MAKKILIITILMLALVCVLASCGHNHEWSAWETTAKATCTINGTETRHCMDKKCDESETRTIQAKHNMLDATCNEPKKCLNCDYVEGEALGHTFKYGNCTHSGCTENLATKLDITVFPSEVPFTINSGNKGKLKILELDWGYEFNKNNTFTLYLKHSGEKVYTVPGNVRTCYIQYQVLDGDGYVVKSGFVSTVDLDTGSKYRPTYDAIAYNLDPNGKYVIEVWGYDN